MRLITIEDRTAPFIDAYKASAIEAGYDLTLVPPSKNKPASFRKFEEVYQHHSDNSYAFEISCFRRYFDALELLRQTDEKIIISDSDQILFGSPMELPPQMRCIDTLVGSIGVSKGVKETDISPHLSSWTKVHLKRFTDFLIAKYENSSYELEAIYKSRKQQNTIAAVSDMTLFYLYVKESGCQFYDTNTIIDSCYIYHNISMSEANNCSFRLDCGHKKLISDSGDILLETDMDLSIKPLSLHFQGRAKIAAKHIKNKNYGTAKLLLKSLTLIRAVRDNLKK